ncbi:MAG: Ig domain-containing protein [Prevotella sp.]|nr:Ig domain-containing protein [Prevotella sp.]
MKRLFTITIALAMCISMFPQAKSLTVDCQTPGWLSSKINYGDQQTVENLKVTGYINSTDLDFIGELIHNRSLNGELDLSEVRIATPGEEDELNWRGKRTHEPADGSGNYRNCFGLETYDSLRVFRFPSYLKKVVGALNCLIIDSVYFNGVNHSAKIENLTTYKNRDGYPVFERGYSIFNCTPFIHNLFLSEEIDSIPASGFDSYYHFIEKLHISSDKLRYVGSRSFYHSYQYASSCHLSNTLPDTAAYIPFNEMENLEYIGPRAFLWYAAKTNGDEVSLLPPAKGMDKIVLPKKLTYFNLSSLNYSREQRTHIYFPKIIETIDLYKCTYTGSTWGESIPVSLIIFHMSSTVPPTLTNITANHKYITVYVPQGSKNSYMNADGWKNMTIIEDNSIQEIHLTPKLVSLEINESKTISISTNPTNPDDNSMTLYSEYEDIAKVEYKKGELSAKVIAVNPGKVKVYAVSDVNPLVKDSIEVTVIQHVTGIKLDRSSVVMTKLGETTKLNAIISPEDATDKSVKWSSSNEAVCLVQDGTLIAVGYGTSIVIATTNDGGHVATCVVTVTPYLYDLNGDGKVSTADIQIIINEMKKPQAEQDSKYDLNGDGKISTADIQMIINEMKS